MSIESVPSRAPVVLCTKCHSEIPTYSSPLRAQFLEKHRSMVALSEIEALRIAKTLEQTNREIEQYNHEIDRLSSTLSALEKERQVAVQSQEIQKALLAPIRRLPIELLTKIFVLSSSEDEDDALKTLTFPRRKDHATAFMSTPGLRIASTCFLWSVIAFSKPILWSTITIRFDSLYSLSFVGRPEEVVKTWLTRSHTMPLTIRAHLWGPVDNPGSAFPLSLDCRSHLIAILEALLIESDRWSSAALALDDPEIRSIVEGPTFSFSRLENLTLAFDSEAGIDSDWLILFANYFHSAPLRQFAVPNIPGYWFDSPPFTNKPAFNLSMVTSLTIDSFVDERLSVLEDFPALTHLRILRYKGPAYLRTQPLPQETPKQLKSLTHLDICVGLPLRSVIRLDTVPLTIFSVFRAPRLQSISISIHEYEYKESLVHTVAQWSQKAFQTMLSSSSCSLQSLSLKGISISTGDFLRILRATPDLEYLSFDHGKIIREGQSIPDPDELLKAEMDLQHKLTYLSLSFTNYCLDNDLLDLICNLLESRTTTRVPDGSSELEYFRFKAGSVTMSQPELMSRFETLARLPGKDFSLDIAVNEEDVNTD